MNLLKILFEFIKISHYSQIFYSMTECISANMHKNRRPISGFFSFLEKSLRRIFYPQNRGRFFYVNASKYGIMIQSVRRVYMRLKEFILGYPNGEHEAKLVENFDTFFYDYDSNSERVLDENRFLVLGRKGVGKTLLAEYVKKKASTQQDWLCDIVSYSTLGIHELLSKVDVPAKEYKALWLWIAYLEIIKLCAQNDDMDKARRNDIAMFFVKTFSLDVFADKNAGFLRALELIIREYKQRRIAKLNEYLKALETIVIDAMKTAPTKYTLFIDNLDFHFINSDAYTNTIKSLIRTIMGLNATFNKKEVDCKILILLRTDIFIMFNDANLQTMKRDYFLKIDWGTQLQNDSPLIAMLAHRLRVSNPVLAHMDLGDIIRTLLPDPINNVHPVKFLLSRSFFRPRHLNAYLRFIRSKHLYAPYINRYMLMSTEMDYAKHMMKEVRMEMEGHFEESKIESAFSLLAQFAPLCEYSQNTFIFPEIEEFYHRIAFSIHHYDLKELLKILFDFNVLNNVWYDKTLRKHLYSSRVKKNRISQIDYDKRFQINPGIRRALIY